MSRFFVCMVWATVLLGFTVSGNAFEPAHKPTHILQPLIIEVQPTQPNGNPWDTGIETHTRPDLQVTLIRADAAGIKAATELLIAAQERRAKELGRPIDPRFRAAFARNAMASLRYGAAIDALQDQKLSDTRGAFSADTSIASDAFISRLANGGLKVARGDKLKIFVNDIDIAVHDHVGETELEITPELLKKGDLELKFNSVLLLRLKLAPLP